MINAILYYLGMKLLLATVVKGNQKAPFFNSYHTEV